MRFARISTLFCHVVFQGCFCKLNCPPYEAYFNGKTAQLLRIHNIAIGLHTIIVVDLLI